MKNAFSILFGSLLLTTGVLGVGILPSYAQFTSSGAEQLSRGGAWNTAPDGLSTDPSSAPNGDIVAFTSRATNLVAGDTNGYSDVFLYTPDRRIELLSVPVAPPPEAIVQGSASPYVSSVLPDGNYAVAFTSDALNLVAGYVQPPNIQTNPRQVYLRLPKLGKTILVSRGVESTSAAISGANSNCDQVSVVAQADPTRFIVAFRSAATNLDNGPSTRSVKTIFVVRIELDGNEPAIKRVESPNRTPDGAVLQHPLNHPVLSGDGRFVAFSSVAPMDESAGPTGGKEQVFLFNYAAGRARLISRAPSGAPGDGDSTQPSLSYQGDFLGFITRATNLVTRSGTTPIAVLFSAPARKITQVNTSSSGEASNGDVFAVSVSPGGKLVAFADSGTNLVTTSGPTGVIQTYIKDPSSGAILRTSTTPDGTPADGNSGAHNIELPSGDTPLIAALSFGGLGFNSRVAYTSFGSVAKNLRAIGANDSFPNVFRTTITPPKPKFSRNAPIEAPPDATISSTLPDGKGATVIFQMQEFDDTASSSSQSRTVTSQASSSARLTYSLEIRKSGSKQRIFRTASRNSVTVRKLTPGSYTVRYRVVKTSGKTVSKTKYSPKGSIQIT